MRGGGADAAAAELIEITWTIGTTQSVPTASPAPFSVARRVTEPVPVFVSDICPSPASEVRRPSRRTEARVGGGATGDTASGCRHPFHGRSDEERNGSSPTFPAVGPARDRPLPATRRSRGAPSSTRDGSHDGGGADRDGGDTGDGDPDGLGGARLRKLTPGHGSGGDRRRTATGRGLDSGGRGGRGRRGVHGDDLDQRGDPEGADGESGALQRRPPGERPCAARVLDILINPSTVSVNRSRTADGVTVSRKGLTPEGIRGRVGADHPM